jgi:hypothetical protein
MQVVKRKRNSIVFAPHQRRTAKQKIVSFNGWLMSFFNYPNLPQNKPHKKFANVTRWRGDDYENGEKVDVRINKDSKGIDVQVQCGFEPNAFDIFNISKVRDVEGCLSEWEEYQYAFRQVKKNNPKGIDVYSKN